MITKTLIALGVLALVFIVVAALQPADFRIARSAMIAAPPSVVFAHFNDFHKWNDWSPWAKMDPDAKHTFDGSPAGVGAGFAWAGNSKVGEGRMTIIESKPNDLIRLKLEFTKPFTAINITEFTFKPEGSQTAVTWAMSGHNNFFAKAFGLFINCDKMVGGDFEKGFANLKAIIEKPTHS